MGVDACMFFTVKEQLEPDTLLGLAIDLREAFGGVVHVWRGFGSVDPGTLEHVLQPTTDARHCIEAIDEYHQDGPTVQPGRGSFMYEVHLSGRFYGEGYERGDLPGILAVAQWLETRLTCDVFYGGDSSGIEAEGLTPERRQALWAHFVEHGHKPYAGDSWRTGDSLDAPPVCKLCKRPYIRFGVGRGYAAYSCHGCGHSIETKDNGVTWKARR